MTIVFHLLDSLLEALMTVDTIQMCHGEWHHIVSTDVIKGDSNAVLTDGEWFEEVGHKGFHLEIAICMNSRIGIYATAWESKKVLYQRRLHISVGKTMVKD